VRGQCATAAEGEAHAEPFAFPVRDPAALRVALRLDGRLHVDLPASHARPREGAERMKGLGNVLANLPRWIEAARRAKKAAGQIVNRIRGRKPNVARPDAATKGGR
jgi:hypothetical protein